MHQYIAVENNSPENAEKFITAIEKQINELLSQSPKIGRLITGNIRFIVVKKCSVIYRINQKHITIIDIHSKGKNWRY